MSLSTINGNFHIKLVIHVDIVFFLPPICVPDSKISKIFTCLQGIAETPRLMWRNPFRHWSTQSSISGQIDQNAPSQP